MAFFRTAEHSGWPTKPFVWVVKEILARHDTHSNHSDTTRPPTQAMFCFPHW